MTKVSGSLLRLQKWSKLSTLRPNFGLLGNWTPTIPRRLKRKISCGGSTKKPSFIMVFCEMSVRLSPNQIVSFCPRIEKATLAPSWKACQWVRQSLRQILGVARENIEEGSNGFLVPVKDISALAQSIIKFLLLPPEQQQEMGAAGRKKVSLEFDDKLIARQYYDLMSPLL